MNFNAQQLYEIGRVFDPGPEPALYYPSVASELLRRRLHASLSTGPGMLVLSGESGAGKTLLARVIERELPRSWQHIAHLSFSAMSGEDLLLAIAHAFGLPAAAEGEDATTLERLQAVLELRHSRGEGSLLVLDEAQGLMPDALRALHRLGRPAPDGRMPLTILLIGAPALLASLDAPELGALGDDFRPRFVLEGFEQRETANYIKSRLARCQGVPLPGFSVPALAEIHARADGVPGRINLLCRELLHNALLEEAQAPIGAAEAAASARDLGIAPVRRPSDAAPAAAVIPRGQPVWPAMALVAFAGLAGIALIAPRPPADPDAGYYNWAVHDLEQPAASPTLSARSALPELPPTLPTALPPVPSFERAAEAARGKRVPTARTMLAAVAPGLVAAEPKRVSHDCPALLTQISLGEPLSPKQKQTLDATCR